MIPHVAGLGLLDVATRHMLECRRDLEVREIEFIESTLALEDARDALIRATACAENAARLVSKTA
jgi:hypothetical protein